MNDYTIATEAGVVIAQVRHVDIADDHGAGCDGPLNCTCPPATYAADDIAAFAAKIEQVASPQVALWYES